MPPVRDGMPPRIAALIAVTLVVLRPVLGTGWFGDDAYYSNLPAAIATGRVTLLGAARDSYLNWLHSAGRWHPGLVAETYGAFALFTDRVAYKSFLILLTLLALAAAGIFLSRLWGSRFALLAVLWTIACFQIRGYHDPLLAYNGILQSVAILVFLSLYVFLSYVEDGKLSNLALSVLLYIGACSVYEITYVFAPLYIVTAWCRRDLRRAVRLSLPIVGVGVAFLAVSAILRAHANVDPADPYAIRPNIAAYARGLFDQLTAAIPLSYLVFNPSKIFLPAWRGFGIPFEPLALAVALLCAFFVVPKAEIEIGMPAKWKALAFGALLILLSAIEIPALVKYQGELLPGLGYLPVFIEYIGFGILVAAGLANVRFTPRLRIIAVGAFAAIVTLSSGANAKLAAIIQTPYLTSRESFDTALQHGILKNVRNGSTLAIVPEYPWVCHDGACIDGMQTSDAVLALSGRAVVVAIPSTAKYVTTYHVASDTWSISGIGQKSNR